MPVPDRRQSETALAVARGTARLLRSLGFSCVSELPLPSGRRADLVALNERGEIWIVEIKSSIEDLRADQKWPEYRAHCDRLFFAFTQDMPCEIFPADTGLIVADAYGAHLHCEAPEHRLPAPTRKLMMVRFAMAAAQRMSPYATAKAAIVGMTNSLAREFGGDNIRVNAIAPGAVSTERQRRLWISESDLKAIVERQCLHRVLLADEIARAALFLASADSAMITKQCLIVDGGLR